jgi:prevent-host-death family protein
MKIASVADVKAKFSGYIKASEEGPVVVTKNGKPVALLLSVKDEEEIERLLLAYSPKFKNIMHVAERQVREGKGIKHDDFWRDIETECK